MSVFDKASQKVTSAVNILQKKTSDTINVKKYEAQIKTIENEIDTLFAAVGKRVYAARTGDALPELGDLFESIDALKKHVADAQEKIDRLNAVSRCASCGAALENGARFCAKCGAAVTPEPQPEKTTQETCPECGAERSPEARFCGKCGHDYSACAENIAPSDAAEADNETDAE